MRIGLDYDGTITADPEFWLDFCLKASRRGHEIYIVTMRYESECKDIDPRFRTLTKGVYATKRKAKNRFMLERGISIQIWIDDNPRAVAENATEIWAIPAPEGSPVDPCNSNVH